MSYKNNGKSLIYNQVEYKSLKQFYNEHKDSSSCNYAGFTIKLGFGIDPLQALTKFKVGEMRSLIIQRNKLLYKE